MIASDEMKGYTVILKKDAWAFYLLLHPPKGRTITRQYHYWRKGNSAETTTEAERTSTERYKEQKQKARDAYNLLRYFFSRLSNKKPFGRKKKPSVVSPAPTPLPFADEYNYTARGRNGLKLLPNGHWLYSWKDADGKYHRHVAKSRAEAESKLAEMRNLALQPTPSAEPPVAPAPASASPMQEAAKVALEEETKRAETKAMLKELLMEIQEEKKH